MQIKVTNKIGDSTYQFNIDEKDTKEALLTASVLGNTPHYCHECKNTDFFALAGNKDKDGNIYIAIQCRKCGAKANLGSYKSGSFFWKKFELWQKDSSKNEQSQAKPSESVVWDE